MDGLRDALIFGWRFGPRRPRYGSDLRQSFRRRLGLSGKYSWRCHVGRGCLGSGESLHRIGMPELWQTVALAGEQQCNQRQTYYRKKAESWHFATFRLHRTQYSEKQLSRALATGRVGPRANRVKASFVMSALRPIAIIGGTYGMSTNDPKRTVCSLYPQK